MSPMSWLPLEVGVIFLWAVSHSSFYFGAPLSAGAPSLPSGKVNWEW